MSAYVWSAECQDSAKSSDDASSLHALVIRRPNIGITQQAVSLASSYEAI
jgi:hypothetical protein